MNRGGTSDEDLMAAVAQGDRAALGELFDRHHRRLYGYLRGLSGSSQAAEEMVQEVFLRLLRLGASYRAGAPFMPWMLVIARNVAWQKLRQASADGKTRPLEAGGGSEERIVPGNPSPEEDLHHLAEQTSFATPHQLTAALAQLSPNLRDALLLRYVRELDHGEVAELLGIGVAASRVRVHRAIAQLRHILGVGEPRLAPAEPRRERGTNR